MKKEDLLHPEIMQCYFENYLTTFQNQFSYLLPELGNENTAAIIIYQFQQCENERKPYPQG